MEQLIFPILQTLREKKRFIFSNERQMDMKKRTKDYFLFIQTKKKKFVAPTCVPTSISHPESAKGWGMETWKLSWGQTWYSGRNLSRLGVAFLEALIKFGPVPGESSVESQSSQKMSEVLFTEYRGEPPPLPCNAHQQPVRDVCPTRQQLPVTHTNSCHTNK